ncbi:hypothetical protein JCM3775_001835 [Rhodotorula graminis]
MLSLCGCSRSRSYSPVPADHDHPQPRGAAAAWELLAVSSSSGRPVHLALTPQGLAVVKQRTKGPPHSLHASSTAHRIIPYRNLVAATATATDSSPSSPSSSTRISLSALVPSDKRKPDSALALWHLDAAVHDVGRSTDQDAGATSDAQHPAAAAWCAEAERRAYAGVERRRRLHCVVNPHGGKGTAKRVWLDSVKPVFDAAGCPYHVSYTGAPGTPTNARALGLAHDSSQYDALVSLSGDGIVHELLNGLAAQPHSGARVLRETPIVHVPCGSGNALATSVYGPERATDTHYAALCALKGSPLALDLSSFSQASSASASSSQSEGGPGQERTYTFLSQAFGLMADLDLGTEHLRRWLGDARFTWGYVQGAIGRRRYPCTIEVKGARWDKGELARRHNQGLLRPARAAGDEGGAASKTHGDDDDMPAPTLVGRREDGRAHRRVDHLPVDGDFGPSDGGVDGDDEQWLTLDLTTEGVFFAYAGKVPFVSKDVMMFPAADPNDGLLDLVLVAPMSPLKALTAMDNASTGGLLSLPSVTYFKCSAYRLSFPPPAPGAKDGFISVDGERVPYRAFDVECHKGLARVMGFDGTWGGRSRIDGFDSGDDVKAR